MFSGLVFTAVGAGYFLALTQAARVAGRVGRQVLALGAVLVAAGLVALDAAAGASSALNLVPGLALIGFGIGLVLVPLAQTVLTGVDPAQRPGCSGPPSRSGARSVSPWSARCSSPAAAVRPVGSARRSGRPWPYSPG